MKEQIKDYIKSRIDILEKESIDLGCELKFDEAIIKFSRCNELSDLKDFITKLEWKEMEDRINYVKPCN